MKKVSIIIPHLPNTRHEFLMFALENIEKQKYQNIEVLIIEQDKSEVENITDGLKIATGDIVHIHHDDDWFTENAIFNGVKYLEGFDFIHGNAHEIGGKDYTPTIKHPTLKQLAKLNVIHNATIFYRRDLFDRVGEYEQDWLFSLKCLERGMNIGYCPHFLKNYRLHPNSLTNANIWKDKIRPGLDDIVKRRYGNLLNEINTTHKLKTKD